MDLDTIFEFLKKKTFCIVVVLFIFFITASWQLRNLVGACAVCLPKW